MLISMLAIGVHFPKAGGNSLMEVLRNKFADRLLLDYTETPALPQVQRHLDPHSYFMRRDPIPGGIACVFGHFHPAKYQHHAAIRFTVLRNPVENMISIYAYFKATPPTPPGLIHQYMLRENLDVVGLARLPLLRRLMSETYFGGVDMKSFQLVGRHEEREQTNAALCKLLDLEPFEDVRANVTPPSAERDQIAADSRICGKLADILHDDMVFYEQWAKP